MAVYFSGRRQVASFLLHPSPRAVLSCEIFERWEDIDLSSTARCGTTGSIEVKKEIGLSERDHHTLTGSIESSIGLAGIASLKSKITESVGREVNWSIAQSTTQAFSFTSKECGRHSQTIYQLVREYELSYRRDKLFGTESWDRILKERTQCHDGVPEIEEWDEACKCPKPTRAPYDGRLLVDMGDLSMRVPFKRTPEGIEIHFGGGVAAVATRGTTQFHAIIPSALLPLSLRFLGDIDREDLNCVFSPYEDRVLRGYDLYAQFGEKLLETTVRQLALRGESEAGS